MGLQQVGLELVVKATGDAQTFVSDLESLVRSLNDQVVGLSETMNTTLRGALENVATATRGVNEAMDGLKKSADEATAAAKMDGVQGDLNGVKGAAEGLVQPLGDAARAADSAAKAIEMPGVVGDLNGVAKAIDGLTGPLKGAEGLAEGAGKALELPGVSAAVTGVGKALEGVEAPLKGLEDQAGAVAKALEMPGVAGDVDSIAAAERSVADALQVVADKATAARSILADMGLADQVGAHIANPAALGLEDQVGVPTGTASPESSPAAPRPGPQPNPHQPGGGHGGNNVQQQAGDMLVAGLMVQQIGDNLLGVLEQANQAGASFERLMNDVASNIGLTASQTEELSQQVAALATEVARPREEMAQALYEIVSLGYSGQEAMQLLKTSAEAAVAGITDTTTAQDALTTVMTAYGKSAKDATGIADTMFKAVADGKLHFGDLASNLGQVIPTAAAAGVSFDQIAAAMAALTNAGVPTAEAATAVNRALIAFIDPSKEAKKAAQEIGLDLSVTELQTKGLAGAMQELMEKTGGNVETIAKVVGDIRGMKAALDLTANGGKEYNRILDDLTQSTGSMSTALEIQSRSFANQEQMVKNNYAAVQDGVFRAALPAMEAFAKVLESVFNWFNNLSPGTQKFLVIVAGIAGIVLSVGGHVMSFIGTLGFLAAAFGTTGVAAGGAAVGIWAALWPILAVIAGIVLLVAAIALIIQHWDQIKAVTLAVWETIKKATIAAWDAVVGALKAAWDAIKDGVKSVADFFSNIWDEITGAISRAWGAIKESVVNGMQAVARFITQTLPEWLMAFVKWGAETALKLLTWWLELPLKLVEGIAFVAGWLSKEIPRAWTAIVDWAKDMGSKLLQFFVDLPGVIGKGVAAVATWLVSNITNGWHAITVWTGNMVKSVVDFFTELPGNMAKAVVAAGAWLVTNITNGWTAITDWIQNVGSSLADWFMSLPGKFVAWIKSIGAAIAGAWDQFKDWGRQMAQGIWDAFTRFFSETLPAWISNTIHNAIQSVKDAVSGWWSGIKDSFKAGQDAAEGTKVPSHADGGYFTVPHLAMVGDSPLSGEWVVNKGNAAEALPTIAAWAGAGGGPAVSGAGPSPAASWAGVAGMSGGGSHQQNITQHILVTGNTARSEDDLAELVASKLWAKVKQRSPVPIMEVR